MEKQKTNINMKEFKLFILSCFAIICVALFGSVFASCSNDDDLLLVGDSQTELVSSFAQDSVKALTRNSAVYTLYVGVPQTSLLHHYGHIYQDRTFYGWTTESNYYYLPNNSAGHPYTNSGYNSLSYYLKYNKNCGVAAYVMARAIAYPASMFGLSDGYTVQKKKLGAQLYCETSMRLHREISSYNFGTPWIADIYNGLAKGGPNYISDEQFINNHSNPQKGTTSGFVSNVCSYPKTTTGLNNFRSELESCLSAGKPFMMIVGINDNNHPIKINGETRDSADYNRYTYPYTKDLSSYNYLKSNGEAHYIVIVGMDKAFGPTWDDFLPDETKVYFLDPYWNCEVIWETTYTKLMIAANVSSLKNYNGFGFK